jgi:hypothetical protein
MQKYIREFMRTYGVSRGYAERRYRLYKEYNDDIANDAFLEEYNALNDALPADATKIETLFTQLSTETIAESLAHKKRAAVRYRCTIA